MAQRQPVLYADFELSIKQLQNRYSKDYDFNYEFDSNFLRVELNPNCTDYEDFENKLFWELEREIQRKENSDSDNRQHYVFKNSVDRNGKRRITVDEKIS